MSPFHAQNHYYAGKNGNNNNNSASTHSLFSTKSSSSSTSSSSSSTSSFGTHSYTKPNLQSPHQEILNLRHQLHQLQQQQTTLIQRESQLMTTMTQKDEEIRVLQHHLYMAAASLSTQAQTQTQGNKPATSQETANLIASLKQQILSKNKEIYTLREKLQSVQFTPESAIGQRLVARCKMLLAENEELGRKSLFLTKTGQLETEVQEWKHIANTLKASLEGEIFISFQLCLYSAMANVFFIRLGELGARSL